MLPNAFLALLTFGSPSVPRQTILSCSRAAELGGACDEAWWVPLAWVGGFFLVVAGLGFAWILWNLRAPTPTRRSVFPIEPPSPSADQDR